MFSEYLLIGSGRVSCHLGHYLRLLGIPSLAWSRNEDRHALVKKADASSHILCLISDPAIEGFLSENADLFQGKTLVHASGAIATPLAESAHPLMTFARDLYDLETYKSIPFIIEAGRKSFNEILPGLPNPHFTIEPELKPLYHALCVMSGNFTVLLWQKVFQEFQNQLALPREVLLPYMRQVMNNLAVNPQAALTGPIARGDHQIIHRHLQVLGNDPYADVYRAFVNAAQAAAPTPIQTLNTPSVHTPSTDGTDSRNTPMGGRK